MRSVFRRTPCPVQTVSWRSLPESNSDNPEVSCGNLKEPVPHNAGTGSSFFLFETGRMPETPFLLSRFRRWVQDVRNRENQMTMVLAIAVGLLVGLVTVAFVLVTGRLAV